MKTALLALAITAIVCLITFPGLKANDTGNGLRTLIGVGNFTACIIFLEYRARQIRKIADQLEADERARKADQPNPEDKDLPF